jgi:hypothetical protein
MSQPTRTFGIKIDYTKPMTFKEATPEQRAAYERKMRKQYGEAYYWRSLGNDSMVRRARTLRRLRASRERRRQNDNS